MKVPNRDLLVLVKDESLSQELIEVEVDKLNRLLVHYETPETYCLAHEVFDLNRYKIITDSKSINKILKQRETKAFVFIYNKN